MKAKKIFIALLIVFLVFCLAIDFWWLGIFMFGADKEIVNTFHVGQISTNPDEETGEIKSEYVIKVKYSSNDNKNGLECLEIEFSGFVDSNKTDIYSYGIQFTGETLENWEYNADLSTKKYVERKWQFPLWFSHYWNVWGSYTPNNSEISYYKSSDGFTSDVTGADSMGNGEGFLISMNEDDEIYKLNFSGNIINDSEENSNFVAKKLASYGGTFSIGRKDYHNYYYSYDIFDFAYMIYNQVQAVKNGKHSASLINLPDMFTYQIYNGKSYDDVSAIENSKVSETVRNFYSIYIEKTADGVRTANDSLFGCVNGTPQFTVPNFDEDDDPQTGEYFSGNCVVNVDTFDFDYVNVEENYYIAKLSDNFIRQYGSFSKEIQLSVCIDLDVLNAKNMQLYKISKNSGLEKFTVIECYTLQTVNGEVVKTGVSYV